MTPPAGSSQTTPPPPTEIEAVEELLRGMLSPGLHEILLAIPGQGHLEILTQGNTTYGVVHSGHVVRHHAAFVIKTSMGDFTVTVSQQKEG